MTYPSKFSADALRKLADAIDSGTLPEAPHVSLHVHGATAATLTHFALSGSHKITIRAHDKHAWCAVHMNMPGMLDVMFTMHTNDVTPEAIAAYAAVNDELTA